RASQVRILSGAPKPVLALCHTDSVSSPASSRRRPVLWTVGSVVLFVALYATVVGLYAGSGDIVGSADGETSGDTVALS
ncbi:hypothetical protein, partial [Enterococcus faecium]